MKQAKKAQESSDLRFVFWKMNMIDVFEETKTHYVTSHSELGLTDEIKIPKKETFPDSKENKKVYDLFTFFEKEISSILCGKNLFYIYKIKSDLILLWEEAMKSNPKKRKKVYEKLKSFLETIYDDASREISYEKTVTISYADMLLDRQKGLKVLNALLFPSSLDAKNPKDEK